MRTLLIPFLVCVWHLVMLVDANKNAYSRLSCTYVAVWFGGLCRKTTEHLMIVKEDVELAIHKLGFVVRSRVYLHASTWQVQYSFPKKSCLVSVLTQPTLGAELWNKRWVQEAKQPSERRGCPSCASPWWMAAGATVTWLKLWDPNYELWVDVKEWENIMHWEWKKSSWPCFGSFWHLQTWQLLVIV